MPAAPSASVFINCPFDKQYQPIFDAIVFCVVACGFEPRCTLELTDAGEVRIENIYRRLPGVITAFTTSREQKSEINPIGCLGSICHWSSEVVSERQDSVGAHHASAV